LSFDEPGWDWVCAHENAEARDEEKDALYGQVGDLEARLKEATEIIRHADRVIGPLSRPDEVEAWERAARPFLDRQL
jgi:hypothetical protein